MMRRFVLSATAWLTIFSAQAQTVKTKPAVANHAAAAKPANNSEGYNIPVTITPFKNAWVFLGCYYGKYKNLVDSAWLNEKSEAVFKSKTKLPGGIYFLVSPQKAILFEVMMDAQQHFSIKADSAHTESFVVTGSKENDLFATYTKYLQQKIPQLTALQQSLKQAKTKADTAQIGAELKQVNKELSDYRDGLVKNNPSSMLALFFKAVKRPELPEGKAGDAASVYQVKDHFWDDVPFNDDRLLRTPFFDAKLEDYFKYYVSPEPDSVIAEVNYLLLSAREGKDMFRYLLGRFTDKYINPEIMGQDKVFLHLFNNFYTKGDTLWLTAKQKEYIFNRAYSLITNQIGEPAPILDLVDSSGATKPLYSLQGPFTFVVFWDPNCGHCKEEVPKIDSIYEAKWKAQGVQIYAVNTAEAAINEWKVFINEHHLQGWQHVYQPREQRLDEQKNGRANYRQLYDVFQTPTLYLLDANKHIIAKRLSIEQFNDLIQAKLKTQTAATQK